MGKTIGQKGWTEGRQRAVIQLLVVRGKSAWDLIRGAGSPFALANELNAFRTRVCPPYVVCLAKRPLYAPPTAMNELMCE